MVPREQIVMSLGAVLPPQEAEARLKDALLALSLPNQAAYTPDEVALIGQVLMVWAQGAAAEAMADAFEAGAL